MTLERQNLLELLPEIDSSCNKHRFAEDRQLLHWIQSATQADIRCAWLVLYHRHQIQIWRYIKNKVFDIEDAQDVFQQVWCAAIGKLSQEFIWQGTPIVAWLQQVAKNQISKHIEKSQRNKRINVAMIALLQVSEEPHFRIDDEEWRYMLIDAVARLKNSMYREIILLHYLQELSINEIADRLDKKPNTIAQAHKRALKHLEITLHTMMEETNGK